MSTEDHKALIRRLFEEVWNQGHLALVAEFYNPDHVEHTPTGPLQGFEALKQFIAMYRSAFPDVHFTIEDQIAEGDRVATRWSARGTHQGPLMGIPPTGKQVMVTAIGLGRFAGGKLVEGWNEVDMLGLMQQLGVVPSMG
jgi:steroid delta-isomerase-like uncharacterized protein